MKHKTLAGSVRHYVSKAIFSTKLPGSIALGTKIMPASSKAIVDSFVESTLHLKKASIPILARLTAAYPDIAVWFRDDTVRLLKGGDLVFCNAIVCMCEFWDDDTIYRCFRNFVHSFETFSVFIKYFQAIPSYLVGQGYMDRETGLIRASMTEAEKGRMHVEMASIMAAWLMEAEIQMWTHDELIAEFHAIFSKGKHVNPS